MDTIPDRGYTNLLTHLHRPNSTLPLPAIQASITHYLAHITPYPTPLAAIIVSSPLFKSKPFSHAKVQVLSTAFRHAVHVKYRAISDDQGGLFAQSSRTRLKQWAAAVLKGIQGGESVMRLACCGGLLLGLQDLKGKVVLGDGGVWSRAADEVVVALAEVMDSHAHAQVPGAWENEFYSVKMDVEELPLALILASQSFLSLPSEKLKALPLQVFARHLMSTINSAFQFGAFLSQLSSSTAPHRDHKVYIDPTTAFARSIHDISISPLISAVGPLSRLLARTLAVLFDTRADLGLISIFETLRALESLAEKVESDWARSALSAAKDENDIAPSTRETTRTIWTVLKTVLFSTIMIADSSLSTTVYLPPRLKSLTPTPISLALMVLYTLSRLSFIISQFGSVTATSQGGFIELKKVFYSALDIVSVNSDASERLVKGLCDGIAVNAYHHSHPLRQAKNAYALATIEQLIPGLSESCIQFQVFSLCLQHISNPVHRETYESSHSVILAIFASHAQHADENKPGTETSGIIDDRHEGGVPNFAKHLVPFYAHCLIENSADGKLSTPQLRLAYSALVRSASVNVCKSGESPMDDQYALAWFCIDTLVLAICSFSEQEGAEERVHRLHLALISTISSLPLPLLPLALNEVRDIVGSGGGEKKQELVDALFGEILERVGDREKEIVLGWWLRSPAMSHL